MTALDALARHEASAYTLERLPRVQPVAPSAAELRDGIVLPRCAPLNIPLGEALRARRSQRDFSLASMSLESLSAWLSVVAAESSAADAPRTYPSAGGLYATRLLVLVRAVNGLANGLYTYQSGNHRLEPHEVNPDELSDALRTMLGVSQLERGLGAASVYAFVTADLECSERKYGARAYRFVLQESGHLTQNLLLASGALGLAALPLGSYLDDQAERIVAHGGSKASVLYVVALAAEAHDADALEAAAQISRRREATQRHAAWQQWRLETDDPKALLRTALSATLEGMRADGRVASWWFLVKSDAAPHLRLRVQPARGVDAATLGDDLERTFDGLRVAGALQSFHRGVYEPERFLFGGEVGMALAHRFFDLDSRFALNTDGSDQASLLWTALLLREAGLDPFEHWDVWQRVLELRPATSATLEPRLVALVDPVRRLVRRDVETLKDDLIRRSSALHDLVRVELPALGSALREAQRQGRLQRGLRELLSVWIVFHWNRCLFTGTFQSRLAQLLTEAWNPDRSPKGGA
jgi:thiopeptide-type bacteriocin biosynthesis protein